MARTLLGTRQPATTLSATSVRSAQAPAHAVEARLRQKRSITYIEAVGKLDAGGHVCNRHDVDALLDAIRDELPEISIEHLPLGLVAKCYLGRPYEVHTIERNGHIIEHYVAGRSLPGALERARGLALHESYAFIEVYTDKLIAVAMNGDTSLVKG